MRWGSEVCDGRLDLDVCTRCFLHSRGLPRYLADGIGRVPVPLGKALGSIGLSGPVWTALRMRELISLQHAGTHEFLAGCDQIVSLCQWTRDLLIRNGVPISKITLSRLGLCEDLEDSPRSSTDSPVSPPRPGWLRFVFVGRYDPTKGPHILIQALRSAPELPMELHLFGIAFGTEGGSFLSRMNRLAGGDTRIKIHGRMSPREVVDRLREYDFLAVPSQCLETGPLVVLEAFKASIPVVGSNLGGIAELVRPEVNGLLVEPGSIQAWCSVLGRICKDRALLTRLRLGIRPPREMDEVTEEMVQLYRVLSKR